MNEAANLITRSNDMQEQQSGVTRVTPNHREHLAKSGLTDTIIEKRTFSVLTSHEAATLLHRAETDPRPPVPALAFPYPGTENYVRLRLDEPGDGPKYLAPSGTESRLYILDDVPGMFDLATDLWLVEGEKKALVACQAGLAAVAAGGVWSFGNSDANRVAKAKGEDGLALHRDFGRLNIASRKVIICFDSDIDSNPKVLAAAARLGQMLTNAGALPHVAYVPGAGATKVGLDDYYASLADLVRNGPEPLRAIIDSVRPFEPAACIEKYVAPNWRVWSPAKQEEELRRAVLVAQELLGGVAFKSWTRTTARVLDLKLADIRDLLPEREQTRQDARAWVRAWLQEKQVTYSIGTETVRLGSEWVSTVHLFQRMALDADALRGPKPQYLNYALDIWQDEEKTIALQKLRESVRYNPTEEDLLGRWMLAVTGKTDPVDRAVIAHFIWQVKRKLNGLPVVEHLMPLLYGSQGCGKTTAIKLLLGPIGEFCDTPGDLQVLSDNRELFRLHRAYVLFFDEMAKATKLDVDILKNRVTQDTLRWRALNMNRVAAGPNNATFIGATNTNLTDLIYDPTGIRRFYEVACQSPMDWPTINTLDYVALWRSIDEHGPVPLKAVLDEVKTRQEAMRPKDAVEEFLAERCRIGGDWTGAATTYTEFKQFLQNDMRGDRWTFARFGRRMQQLLGPDRVKTSNGRKYNIAIAASETPVNPLEKAIDEMKAANEEMEVKKTA